MRGPVVQSLNVRQSDWRRSGAPLSTSAGRSGYDSCTRPRPTTARPARLGRGFRPTVAIFGLAVRNRMEEGERNADDNFGHGRADAFDPLPHEAHPVFQRPAVAARPVARAQQFVAKVPVAL